jgi:cell division protein FtsB
MVLFAGDKSLVSLLSLYKDRDRLAQELVEVEKTNQRLKDQINELRTHPQAVEPIAREELGLVREGERVYRFVPEPVLAEETDPSRKLSGSIPSKNAK